MDCPLCRLDPEPSMSSICRYPNMPKSDCYKSTGINSSGTMRSLQPLVSRPSPRPSAVQDHRASLRPRGASQAACQTTSQHTKQSTQLSSQPIARPTNFTSGTVVRIVLVMSSSHWRQSRQFVAVDVLSPVSAGNTTFCLLRRVWTGLNRSAVTTTFRIQISCHCMISLSIAINII